MLVLGGVDRSGEIVSQVMSSADGVSWIDVGPRDSSVTGRKGAAFVSDGYQIVVAGGEMKVQGLVTSTRDVLVSFYHCHEESCASAGAEWTPGTSTAQWSARAGLHLAEMGDMILLIGGREAASGAGQVELSDVWVTQQRCRKGQVGPACRPCDPGTFSLEEGALTSYVCEACPKGHEAPESGSEACRSCARGFYADSQGMPSCLPCPPGHIQQALASKSEACTPCPAGTHQPLPGMTECVDCPQGYYCAEGASDPVGCPLGSYTDFGTGKGLDSCVCIAGFSSQSGSAPCQACAQGSYQPLKGSNECLACPAGKITSSDASIADWECESFTPPPPPASTPQRETFDFRLGIAAEMSKVNASIPTYIQAIAMTARVSTPQVSLTGIKEMRSGGSGVYTDAAFAIVVDMRDIQEVSASFQLEALNNELSALKLVRVYSIVPGTGILLPAETPSPSPAVPDPSPSWYTPSPETDIITGGSSAPQPGQVGRVEEAGIAAAIVLIVLAALVCCCCRLYRRLRSKERAGESGQGISKRQIDMRQLPLVFKSRVSHSQGYERTALVQNSGDDEDADSNVSTAFLQ